MRAEFEVVNPAPQDFENRSKCSPELLNENNLVDKKIIESEVLGIVNGEIVKVTDENVQKEIYISTEVLGIVNSEMSKSNKLECTERNRYQYRSVRDS